MRKTIKTKIRKEVLQNLFKLDTINNTLSFTRPIYNSAFTRITYEDRVNLPSCKVINSLKFLHCFCCIKPQITLIRNSNGKLSIFNRNIKINIATIIFVEKKGKSFNIQFQGFLILQLFSTSWWICVVKTGLKNARPDA